MTLAADVAAAYGSTGAAWASGPARVYGRLAEVVCERSPVSLTEARVLDLGSGTGAVTDVVVTRGANAVAVDVAVPMLSARTGGTPAAAADAASLPFRRSSFDVVIAAFCLNHLADPVAGMAEMRRVLRPGGGAVVSSYSERDVHPVRAAVDAAARAAGWRAPAWYARLHAETAPLLATPERARALARGAGVADPEAACVDVVFPDLVGADLVAWRLGMAHVAPFVASLGRRDRERLAADALATLGTGFAPLTRSVIVLTWREVGAVGRLSAR